MVWGFCVYFVYMIPLETDVLRKHRFQKSMNTIRVSYTFGPRSGPTLSGLIWVQTANCQRISADLGLPVLVGVRNVAHAISSHEQTALPPTPEYCRFSLLLKDPFPDYLQENA